MPYDLGLAAMVWMAVAVFGAGFVRGYSGFGFSALVVAAAGLVTSPLNCVAVVVILEVLLSGQVWKGISRDVDWRRVWLLLAGAVIGLPLGLWALTAMAEDTARAVISGYILAICLILALGLRLRAEVGRTGTLAAGLVSGLANAPGMGGLPVAAFLAAQPMQARVFRAVMVAYLPLLDLYSAPLYLMAGLVTGDTFIATALALPLAFAGNALGGRQFTRRDPQDFRKFAIGLLAALATLGLMKSFW